MHRRSLSLAAGVLLLGCGSASDPVEATDAATLDADTRVADTPAEDAAETASDAVTDAPDDSAPLDCTWVRDPANCWRAFVSALDDCVANPVGAARGSLATDHATCAYPSSGRAIAFAIPAVLDGPDRADRDLTVSLATTTCLHYVESAAVNGFTATSPAGTLTYVAVGNDVRVECPDGTRFRGDALSITKLCGPAVFSGGAPGRTTSSSGGEVRLQLNGMKDVVYACVVAGDAG